jgi:hypothetical protein
MNKQIIKMNLSSFFIITILIAIVARIIWILTIPNLPISDFGEYQNIASSLAEGVIPSGFGYQGMGYPAFLSIFYRIFGSNDIIIAKVLNVILSTLTLLFIFFILKRIFQNKLIIGIIFFIIALLPNHIAYTSVVGTEVLTNFLFALLIWIQVSTLKNKYKYPLLGVLIGLATLTKPFFLAYPILLMVIEWLNKKDFKQTILLGMVTFILLQVTISPWTIYNYKRYGELVPVSSNGGVVLYINNNEDNKWGTYMGADQVTKTPEFEEKISQLAPKSPAFEHALKEEAIKWIKNNPLEFIKLGIFRVENTFLNTPWDIPQYTMNGIDLTNISEKNLKLYTIVFQSLYTFLYFMTVFGLLYGLFCCIEIVMSLFSLKKKLDYFKIIPTLNIAMFLAVHFVFEGQPRYNFPVLFLFVINSVLFCTLVFKGFYRLKNIVAKR